MFEKKGHSLYKHAIYNALGQEGSNDSRTCHVYSVSFLSWGRRRIFDCQVEAF